MIHRHHPHVIQGICHKDRILAAYSLGNCIFGDAVSLNGKVHIKQNQENKKSFVLDVEIEKGVVREYSCHGFKDSDEGIVFFDIKDELNQISKHIENIRDLTSYENMRITQFNTAVCNKFGKRDFRWLISRLNYYSIGARVLGMRRKRQYKKEIIENMKAGNALYG